MPRILIRQNDVVRRFASVKVTHDGSIKLNLVRSGQSTETMNWHTGHEGATAIESQVRTEDRTKTITIHTSGRINYHYGNASPIFVPCLMDLTDPVSVIGYSIPAIDSLDPYTEEDKDDFIIDIPTEVTGRLTFLFDVVPALHDEMPGEIMKFGVEGLYALVLRGMPNPDTPEGIPERAFTFFRPDTPLPAQAIPEEVAYLRFKNAMYANDVIAAVQNAPNRDEITLEHIEAAIQAGPGLFPPNKDGVWTYLARVPKRVAPEVKVNFEDERYTAEVVELRKGDTRLATVRVRFKVFDNTRKAYVKGPVAIHSIELDADFRY